MRTFFSRLKDVSQRADAALMQRLGWVERWSRRLGSPGAALAASLLWVVPIVAVKVVLLKNFILTSDIAYYENMLYNTGVDFSTRSVDYLYTYRDVLYFHSRTFLTEHFSPTFALVAPFYRLFRGPLFLVLLQPLLIALAGMGIYRLARRLMERNRIPAVFGLVPVLFQVIYLFNYSNVSATVDSIYGFHHDSLIPPLLVWTLVCIVESRWKTAAALFVLLLGMKENLPIIFSGACGFCLLFNGLVPRRKAAWGLLIGAAFFACCYIFEFRTHNRHVAILYQFRDVQKIYDALGLLDQRTILDYFFLPAFFTPALALPAIGELCLELMGIVVGAGNSIDLDWHSYPLIALFILGTLFTGIRVLRFTQRSKVAALSLYLAFIGFVVGPLVSGGCYSYAFLHEAADQLTPLADAKALESISGSIPRNARLAVTSDLLTFCANRRYLLWPELGAYADYILVNRRSVQENQMKADRFAAALVHADDAASDHFHADINVVLLGYAYDDNLIKYVDRGVALHTISQVSSIGGLSLYRAVSPPP